MSQITVVAMGPSTVTLTHDEHPGVARFYRLAPWDELAFRRSEGLHVDYTGRVAMGWEGQWRTFARLAKRSARVQ